MGVSRIQLTIDRLMLKGFDQADSRALTEALRAQLSEMMSDPLARSPLISSRRIPLLRLGRMPIESGTAGARRFGKQMARAMGRGLKP